MKTSKIIQNVRLLVEFLASLLVIVCALVALRSKNWVDLAACGKVAGLITAIGKTASVVLEFFEKRCRNGEKRRKRRDGDTAAKTLHTEVQEDRKENQLLKPLRDIVNRILTLLGQQQPQQHEQPGAVDVNAG